MESHRHPEWKRLIDEILPRISNGETKFKYDDLSEMAGCDIRKKRHQFYRLRLELRETQNVWLECIRNYGYEIIEPQSHSASANKRVTGARRRIRDAHAIATHTPLERLTEIQLKHHVATMSLIGSLASIIEIQSKQISTILNHENSGTVPEVVAQNLKLVREST